MLQTKSRKNEICSILFGVRKLGDVNFVFIHYGTLCAHGKEIITRCEQSSACFKVV
jgi:hypothetical protein